MLVLLHELYLVLYLMDTSSHVHEDLQNHDCDQSQYLLEDCLLHHNF